MIKNVNIGDKVIDDTQMPGIIDAIPGDRVQIDRYGYWDIPTGCAGVRSSDGWFIISMRLLRSDTE